MGVSVSFPAAESVRMEGRKKTLPEHNGTNQHSLCAVCWPSTSVEAHTSYTALGRRRTVWATEQDLDSIKKGREREKETEKKRGKCGDNEKERPSEPRGIRNFSPHSV